MEDMEDSERHRERWGRVVKEQGPGVLTAYHVVDFESQPAAFSYLDL